MRPAPHRLVAPLFAVPLLACAAHHPSGNRPDAAQRAFDSGGPSDSGDSGGSGLPTADGAGHHEAAVDAKVAAKVDAKAVDARVAPDARRVDSAPPTPDARRADSAPPAPDAPSCGACPPGFQCTDGGACKSPTGVPRFSHVFLIYMENESYGSIIGNSSAPYINSLATTYGLATNYFDVSHPSLPNYIALSSGSTYGITSDCSPTGCPISATSLADQLESAGLTWHAYDESMGSACNLNNSYPYAPKHNPFVYFTDIQGTPRCTANDVDYGHFSADLAAGGSTFMGITPNLCDDMHDDCYGNATATGDQWLKANVAPILASSAWKNDGVLFIVWDEGESGGDQVVALVISPLGKPGFQSGTYYDHYSLLATIEDAYGLPRLANAKGATPMADFFR